MTTLVACTAKVEEYKTSYETNYDGNSNLLTEIKTLHSLLSHADKEYFKTYIAERCRSPVGKQTVTGACIAAVAVPVIDAYFSGVISATRIVCGGILGFFGGATLTGAAVPRPQTD